MTSQTFLEDLLNAVHLPLPTADNKHLAFRFLLDAEYHVRRTLPPDSPFLNGSGDQNVTPLNIGKRILMRILHPAWHPSLHECEDQLSTCVPRNYQTLPQPSPVAEYPLSVSGSGFPNSHSLPRLRSSFSGPNPPLMPLERNEVGGEFELKDLPLSMHSEHPAVSRTYDPEPIPTAPEPPCITSIEEGTGSTSTYSALLPEQHCPPFVDTPTILQASSTPYYQDTTLSKAREFLSVDIPSHTSSLPSSTHNLLPPSTEAPSLEKSTSVGELVRGSPESVLQQKVTWSCGDQPMDGMEGCYRTVTDGPTCTSSLLLSPPETSSDGSEPPHLGRPPSALSEQTPYTNSHRMKRKKRTLERPPGLPLGPWSPNDTNTLPREIPPRKPRRVRQAPSRGPPPSAPQGREKVSCPECSSLLKPKSLSRHLERHSNWTKGKYNAHLYCRYCFAAYSRMDSLFHHQKTDADCVQMQYEVYWGEREEEPEPCRARKT